jgi:hypothetical protein
MEYEERRRRKSSTVITVWRVEVKSKQQIKEDIENFIIENIEEVMEMEDGVGKKK